MYRLHPDRGVIRLADEAHILPRRSDPAWVEYRAWVTAGNVPDPATPNLEPLADIADRVRSRINQERDRREQAGFTYMGKVLDSDQVSAIRITMAAQTAQMAIATGQPFSVDWTAADNTVLTLGAEQMMGVPAALAAHSDACHQAAKVKKGEVNALLAAEDRAGLESYDVTSGWPI